MKALSRDIIAMVLMGGLHKAMQDIARPGTSAFAEPMMTTVPEAGDFYLAIGELPIDNMDCSIRRYYTFAFVTVQHRYPVDILDLIAYTDSVAIRVENIEHHIYSRDGSLMGDKELKRVIDNIITATPELRKLANGQV